MSDLDGATDGTRADHLAALRRLVTETAEGADVDELVAVTLGVLCDALEAEGAAWRRDGCGTWRPAGRRSVSQAGGTATAGDRPPAFLLDTATTTRLWRSGTRGGALVAATPVRASGRPEAALQVIVPPGAVPETVLRDLCETAAAILGRRIEGAADRDRHADTERTARVGSWILDVCRDELRWSRQTFVNLGLDPDGPEPSLDGYLDLVHPDDRARIRSAIDRALETGRACRFVHRTTPELSGPAEWIEVRGHVHQDPTGSPMRLSGTCQDITERKRLETELDRRSTHDGLTGLPNRLAFQTALEQLLAGDGGRPWATVVAMLDVDQLTKTNGELGSAAGDQLLQQIAGRLRRGLPDGITVARLSGDEFAVVEADRPAGPDRVVELGRRILEVFDEPFALDGQARRVDASVGVATNAEGTESVDDLLRDAGIAVSLAKSRGGGRCHVFDPSHHDGALAQLALEADLRQAVEADDLDVVYQPIVAVDSRRITGAEALVRWRRSGHGPVPPASFVPLAEQLGLIDELGRQVLQRACRQVSAWQERHADAAGMTAAVNVSAVQLDDPQILDTVEEALSSSGLAAEHLLLEITEGAVARDAPAALERLEQLRSRGVRIAIDDFGTGYSSLARLRELPIDVLKIDRSFLADADGGSPILRSLFSMAHTLQLDVIAEGVETPAQLQAVIRHGGQRVQGYLFAAPGDGDAAGRLLAEADWETDPPRPADEPPPEPSPLTRIRELLATGARDARGLLGDLLAAVAEATDMESVYLTRIDWDEQLQHVRRAVNRGDIEIPEGLSVAWADTLCRRALTDDRRVIEDVPGTHPDLEAVAELGIATYVSAPVRTDGGEIRGTLCAVSSRHRAVCEETTALLRDAAALLADHELDRTRA